MTSRSPPLEVPRTSPAEFVYTVPACCGTTAQVEADFTQPIVVAASTAVTNSNNTTTGQWVVNVSEADSGYRLAPESIAVAYGQNFASSLVVSGVQPLPPSIDGVTVAVKESAGVSAPGRSALYQVNVYVPRGLAGAGEVPWS